MFFGRWSATIEYKSASSANSLAPGCTPWSLHREKYGLVTASYGSQLDAICSPSLFLARNGNAAAVATCPLSGAKRKTSARSEYFAF